MHGAGEFIEQLAVILIDAQFLAEQPVLYGIAARDENALRAGAGAELAVSSICIGSLIRAHAGNYKSSRQRSVPDGELAGQFEAPGVYGIHWFTSARPKIHYRTNPRLRACSMLPPPTGNLAFGKRFSALTACGNASAGSSSTRWIGSSVAHVGGVVGGGTTGTVAFLISWVSFEET